MHYLKFFIYQFLLFTAAIVLDVYFGASHREPFSLVSILKTVIIVLLAMSTFGWGDKLNNQVSKIRLRDKLLLSLLAVALATLFGSLIIEEITF